MDTANTCIYSAELPTSTAQLTEFERSQRGLAMTMFGNKEIDGQAKQRVKKK